MSITHTCNTKEWSPKEGVAKNSKTNLAFFFSIIYSLFNIYKYSCIYIYIYIYKYINMLYIYIYIFIYIYIYVKELELKYHLYMRQRGCFPIFHRFYPFTPILAMKIWRFSYEDNNYGRNFSWWFLWSYDIFICTC